MKIKPEELEEKGYIKLDELVHKELVPFIQMYMKKRTKYSVIYYISNLIIFGIVGYLFVQNYNSPDYSFGERFTHFSYGLAIAFALLPFHEYIHVLAYKSQGAEKTSYDVKVLNMELLAYNFHESLNLKPLFAYLQRTITDSKEEEPQSA